MTTPNRHSGHEPQHSADTPPAPANRAERRARRKGSAAGRNISSPGPSEQIQRSQVSALPKYKGRRGNR